MGWNKNNLNTSDVLTNTDVDNWDTGISDLYNGNGLYVVTSGSANTYVATFSPAYTSYTAGMTLRVKFNTENTGTSTVNVDTLGAKTIKKVDGSDIDAGDIITDNIYLLVYDGTNFILVNHNNYKFKNQVFTSSGNFTVPKTGSYKVTVVGGGGSSASNIGGSNAFLGGGGAGGVSKKVVSLTKNDSISVTIGAGGVAAGFQSNGVAGNTSSFSAFCSATGGFGGTYSTSNIGTGGSGGSGVGGDINLTGENGGFATQLGASNTSINFNSSKYQPYGAGGESKFGITGNNGNDGVVIVEWMEV